jgi:hypothetical protein
MWMGARLHRGRRCPGALERGFLERIKTDCREAVDWVVMWHLRQHPEQMN